MGISRGTIGLLAITLGARPQRERVVTFGVQKVEAEPTDIRRILEKHGFPVQSPGPGIEPSGTEGQSVLFSLMGFRRIDSIDYYPDEGPSFMFDLNHALPVDPGPAFDLVYDGGTMEHCFDPAQVLRNAASLVAPEGLVIHHVPINNWVDHGFYQFSPTLFFDFYAACGFVDLNMKIHFKDGDRESYVTYDPARDPPVPYALGGKKRVLAFFCARRPANSVLNPLNSLIQGRYRATFGDEPQRRGRPKTLLQRLRASSRKRFFGLNAKTL